METLLLNLDKVPLFEQLKNKLKLKINHGTYQVADRIPPQTKLAKEFSVSQITVRRAIQELIDEGLLVARAGSGTYVVDKSKNKLNSLVNRQNKSNVIAIVFKDIVGGFPLIKPMFAGVREKCKEMNYELQFIELTDESLVDSRAKNFPEMNFAGVILTSPVDISMLNMLQKKKIPYILLHNDIADGISHCVSCNYASGTMQATLHLLDDKHCKNLLLITPEESRYSTGQRKMGFELAIKSRKNISCIHNVVYASYNEDDVYPIIKSYIDNNNVPDGIILSSIGIARMLVNVLKYSNMSQCTTIVSFGEAKDLISSNITLIESHNGLTGMKAMEVLGELIGGKKPANLRELIEPELIVK